MASLLTSLHTELDKAKALASTQVLESVLILQKLIQDGPITPTCSKQLNIANQLVTLLRVLLRLYNVEPAYLPPISPPHVPVADKRTSAHAHDDSHDETWILTQARGLLPLSSAAL